MLAPGGVLGTRGTRPCGAPSPIRLPARRSLGASIVVRYRNTISGRRRLGLGVGHVPAGNGHRLDRPPPRGGPPRRPPALGPLLLAARPPRPGPPPRLQPRRRRRGRRRPG